MISVLCKSTSSLLYSVEMSDIPRKALLNAPPSMHASRKASNSPLLVGQSTEVPAINARDVKNRQCRFSHLLRLQGERITLDYIGMPILHL